MKNRLLACLASTFVFFTGTAAAAQTTTPAPRADTQQWNDAQLTVPLDDRFDLLLLGTVRFGRGVENLVEGRGGAGLNFKAHESVTLLSSYQYIRMTPTPGRKSYEHRLTFGGTYRFTLRGFTISDRNIFERRLRSPQADSSRYRNRIQVERPVTLGEHRFNLFISNEIFYDFAVDDLSRNRLIVGVGRRFNNNFAADFYYLHQSDGRGRPGDLNVIGVAYRFGL